ncbi:cellulase family glycosylhydrolase [Gilvimarinus algae]|uniref:Cellulase family glycosylhydrolase n=1 Tax=Gilvimarinus algae TaxID=3058037 RepID=A0ABT8TJQ5_9GAMM|nr:cellulase family glycosylhydrolase [Gilvimarinus sp. SDUM040014]MDO3383724.1 cellulase family glycosylhydrolase [Gilvimarinus sp. SDUM040014]
MKTLSFFSTLTLATAIGITVTGCGSSSSGSDNSTGSSSSSSSSSSVVSSSSSSQSSTSEGLTMLKTAGTQWVDASGNPVILKGTNLGNWLLQEFWMMGQSTEAVNDQCTLEGVLDERFGQGERERLMELFRDNWITERDWDQMAEFGLNVVRLPFVWNLIEDENNPYTLRDDAWVYLDRALAEAAERNIYVILDLHGAAGSQGWEHHSGCAERNWYWEGGNGEPASYYQERTIWLWEQIAERYKDNETVAAYGLLNEPWGTDPEPLAEAITTLYEKVRAVDSEHIIILPGHSAGIDAYGDPQDRGMENVAFEMHFYPGIFGWGEIGYQVQRDWLTCGPTGTTGVCEWDTRLTALDTPFLIGEFQPWTGQGLDLGARITRATYDTYGQYGWAATNWSYKVLTNTGGQGAGTWGMVTNEKGLGLLTKADTWACAGWDSDLDTACGAATPSFTAPGEGEQTFYFVIKTGACCEGSLNVTFDNLALVHETSGADVLSNGGFGDSASWNTWTVGEPISVNASQSDASLLPAGAEAPALQLSSSGESNGGLYQQITLTGGETYRLDGVFKDNSSASSWAEIYLVSEAPADGVDITGESLPQLDFHTAPLDAIEQLFTSFGTMNYDVHEDLKTWMNSDTSPELFELPATVQNLALMPTQSGQQLSWDAVSGEIDGYRVYRSAQAGNLGTMIAEVDGTGYTDTAAAEQTYYYRVSAYRGDAVGYASATVATDLVAIQVPGRIEAEAFSTMNGIELETTGDTGGGQNIGYLDAGDWIDYFLTSDSAGTYTASFRLASAGGSSGFNVLVDGELVETIAVPDTGDWQAWQTVSGEVSLPAGDFTLRLEAIGGSWNLNWIELQTP